jgi:fimbrial chaperone protein
MRPTPVRAALIALGCLLCGTVEAASLQISPVIVNLANGQSTATIEVKNRGDAPTAIQVRPYLWTQVGDEDTLTPTQEIILSPPIFTIPPGASQTLRLLLRGTAEAGRERSYRLLLDEVPAADIRNQAQLTLRVSLPVIVASALSAPPALQWRAERGPGGKIALTAINLGPVYDRVSAIGVTLADNSHPKVIPSGNNPYVLPGAQRHWLVQTRDGALAGPLHLSVTTRAGESQQTLAAP